jgi:ATP:ADP antiporter, AAA family
MIYSRVVDRLSRLDVARGASLLFSGVLLLFWAALTFGGSELGSQRWFVWSVFIMVDVYSTVMVGIFWTYTNDVVHREEADKLYGPIGIGGIVGGIAGGLIVDGLVGAVGDVNIILLCAAIGVGCAGLVWVTERKLKPPPRKKEPAAEKEGLMAAFAGLRQVGKSRYLLLIVGVVLGYEFAAATTDYVVNVVFEEAYHDQTVLAEMFGRLGWIVSVTALVSQLVIVPVLLPKKRIALLVPPIAMIVATVGLAIVPLVWMAIVLSAADRGLNYSLQQVTKESLYVPLTDVEKYKAKAFIDMVVDRGAKALSSIALVVIIAFESASVTISLGVALGALALWALCAAFLGRAYKRRVLSKETKRESDASPDRTGLEKQAAEKPAVGKKSAPLIHVRPRYESR